MRAHIQVFTTTEKEKDAEKIAKVLVEKKVGWMCLNSWPNVKHLLVER
jgi:uncharacterized protein involved in tolerance to divalent cations